MCKTICNHAPGNVAIERMDQAIEHSPSQAPNLADAAEGLRRNSLRPLRPTQMQCIPSSTLAAGTLHRALGRPQAGRAKLPVLPSFRPGRERICCASAILARMEARASSRSVSSSEDSSDSPLSSGRLWHPTSHSITMPLRRASEAFDSIWEVPQSTPAAEPA